MSARLLPICGTLSDDGVQRNPGTKVLALPGTKGITPIGALAALVSVLVRLEEDYGFNPETSFDGERTIDDLALFGIWLAVRDGISVIETYREAEQVRAEASARANREARRIASADEAHRTAIDAAARICTKRRDSLYNESHNSLAALEASKCAQAITRIRERGALALRPDLTASQEEA